VGSWHYRRIDMSLNAGEVINNAYVDVHPNTSSGTWHMYFQDMALVSANGTVYPLLTRESSVAMWAYGGGQTNLTYTPTISTATADVTNAAQTTYYYHGDQIGSSRLMTSGGGWPVWQGTFLPYGEEYNPQIGTNHYKFTGKERDDESGLDYFGKRYYGSGLGRFITPDWAAKATAVPYAEFADPQSLNLYTYVRNIPTTRVDTDGHCTGDDCAKITVKAEVIQDAEVHPEPRQNNVDAASVGGTVKYSFTYDGKDLKNTEVTEQVTRTVTENGVTKRMSDVTSTTDTAKTGAIVDNTSMVERQPADPANPQANAAVNALSTSANSKDITQVLTVTSPGGSPCAVTETRSLTNIDSNGKGGKTSPLSLQ
jgi:RHS repeat-associated protein